MTLTVAVQPPVHVRRRSADLARGLDAGGLATRTPRRRAVLAITADHPARGDARVVRRTARCGNVGQVPALPSGSRHVSVRCERGGDTAMSVIWWILFAVIWIAIAFWPARVAGRKGHSFIGYFIFSLFFFPAAIIVAYLVPDRTQIPGAERAAVS